jgi:metal-responsive CopG/Arc/MetJ family transcriptional regulator
MSRTITVTLPADVRQAVDELSREEGVSADEVVGRAIKQRLFLRQSRSLRERMSAKAKNQGVFTDQDVLDRVS